MTAKRSILTVLTAAVIGAAAACDGSGPAGPSFVEATPDMPVPEPSDTTPFVPLNPPMLTP